MVGTAPFYTAATVLFSIAVLYVLVNCKQEYNGTLRLVNVIFRHGQRAPVDLYPTDPHINFTFLPFGLGQLTLEGRRQQYQLGKFLHSRYEDFLVDGFANDIVRAESTDVDRTMMSAQLLLAGLFPPTDSQRWNPHLDWQPVPVHAQPLNQDTLLLVRVPCPRYYEELATVKDSPEVKPYLMSMQELFQALSNHSGLLIKDPDDVQSLYNTLLAEKLANLPLPEWTNAFFPEKMAAVTAYSFTLNAFNDELKKLKGGPLLKKMLNDAKAKYDNPKSRRKMYVYAGHDSTVANLMMALNVWEEQIPNYSIMAIVELHQLNDSYGMKIFLKNTTEGEPTPLRLPGCEELCPLERVVELTKAVIPGDLHAECVSRDPNYTPPPPSGP